MAETTKTTRTRTTKKAVARKKVVRRKPATAKTDAAVSDEQRRQMIAEAAYYLAENREFAGGDPRQDWLAAEADIDARLAEADKRRK